MRATASVRAGPCLCLHAHHRRSRDAGRHPDLTRPAGPRRPHRPASPRRRPSAPTRRRCAPRSRGTSSGRRRRSCAPGGTLGTAGGATASDAARAWLDSNRSLFRLGSLAGITQVSDSRLAASDTHAITLRQTPGGVAASGGGLVTIGVTKAAGAWKVVSASSSISGDETLASGGSAKLSDAQAWQRAAINVGHNTSLARVTRIGTRKLGLPRGWHGLHVAGLSDVQRSRQVAFPTLTRGYIPAFETLVRRHVRGRAVGLPRVRRRQERQRYSPARTSSTTTARPTPRRRRRRGPPRPPRLQRRRSAGRCRRRTPAATPRRARSPSPTAPASARSTCSPTPTTRRTTSSSSSPAGVADPVAEQDTVRTPERIRYAPDGGVPAGDYGVQVCEFGDGARRSRPRHVHGHDRARRPPPRPSLHRALARVPGQPAAGAARAGPVEQPEHRHAREPLLEAEHDAGGLRPRRRQPRLALAVGLRRRDGRAVEHDERQQRPTAESWTDAGAARAPNQFHPVEPDPRLHVPVDEPVVHAGLQPGHAVRRRVPGRQELRRRGGGDEPVRDAQPHARLLLPPRLHRGQLERPAVQLRPDRGLRARTTRCSATRRRARCRRPDVYAGAQQREHGDAAGRVVVDHEHVPVAAGRGRVLPAVRRRRLRRRRHRPRVHAHDREPDDRQGRPALRLPGRRDGRGRRRPRRDRAAQRERPRADRRREPVRGRHVRDRQQGPRHPQLRGELAADRAFPSRASSRRSTR